MTIQLTAELRVKKTRGGLSVLRGFGKIPGNVFGHGTTNHTIEFDSHDFEKMFQKAGTSNLIDLVITGLPKALKVLVSEIQRDPLTDKVVHVDLHQVRMDETIRTEVDIEFIGESPAVKSLGGNLIINKDKLTIECLPNDLISAIQIDLSILSNLDDSIHIKDLVIPAGITIVGDLSESVVSVLAPRAEVLEEKPTPETVVAGKEGEPAETTEAAATPEKSDSKKADSKKS